MRKVGEGLALPGTIEANFVCSLVTAALVLAFEVGKPREMPTAMHPVGTIIDEVGTLIRDGAAFCLRRDLGGRYQLELQRTPVDLVE
jgi:hypothetical protein